MSLLQEIALGAKSATSYDQELFALPAFEDILESIASKVLLLSDHEEKYDSWPEKSTNRISEWLSPSKSTNHPAL